ncbi:MAG TPA: hypothetical protein DEG69_06195 [Flavobacteriaceae bacterium]|jgi:hypothetical protein|nr:hypothetical protein [Flavobacteriaceae bacterium]|tara:strand:+ start:14982 stop:15476 length:495 start_codon:yes stop_codon:yes gene_type:complete
MNLKSSKRFEVTVEGTHAVYLPEEIVTPFLQGNNTRVKVKAFFEENEIEFHAALRKRLGRYVMTFGKRYQKELGIFPSDYFQMELFEDTTKYGVLMPKEMEAVFESDPEALEIFENFSDGKKRSLIYYVKRFKTSQTRIDKALMISENIKMGIIDQRELVKKHY